MKRSRAWTACGLVVLGLAPPAGAQVLITYRNSRPLPATTLDQSGTAFAIGGVSGLTALPDGRFAAVMDNSDKVIFFRPAFSAEGSLETLTEVTGLTLSQSRDYEDIAHLPGTNQALLVDEGGAGGLTVVDLGSGAVTQLPPLPAVFNAVRPNLGIESVTVAPSGLTAWVCNEEATWDDGGLSTASAGTRVRLQRLTRSAGDGPSGFAPSGQWCYITQPWHGLQFANAARNGVCALVDLPGLGLLAMERSFASSVNGFFRTRMFSVGVDGATETSAVPALAGVVLVPCAKSTRYAGGHENIEGLALGPVTAGGPPGRRVLLAVADDGDPLSGSNVHAFVIDGLPSAGCGPADLGSQGGEQGPDGQLDNNDFVVFINRFFSGDGAADLGRQGGVGPGDGAFDNNDFVVFIDAFFAGC